MSRIDRMRRRRGLKAFARDDGGATAVEFAMVGIPFFFMLFMMMELALVLVINMSLDDAVRSATRRIRTGELQQSGGSSLAAFREDVCSRMVFMAEHCRTHLTIDVRVYEQWSGANPPSPMGEDGEFTEVGMQFDPGEAEQIVLARAFYRWPVITPFLSRALIRTNAKEAVITATTTFRNEPYQQ